MNVPLLRFRCLRNVRQPLGAFHILVGPNASGKTTFLDVFALLGRLVSSGLEATISERSHNLSDLFWGKSGTQFYLAIEALIPDSQYLNENKILSSQRSLPTNHTI
ncbi:MAG: AAA family ATPase [Pseudomonadota bacterium]